MGTLCASEKTRHSALSDVISGPVRRGAIALLSLAPVAACAGEPRLPDGRYARGGASLFVEPRGASAMVFAGPISPLAYDYDAMAAAGALGCMKEDKGPSLANGARLIDAGLVTVDTPRARGFAVGFDRETGAHVASAGEPLFAPGEPVTTSGRGSPDVPPFAATVTAPGEVVLTAPEAGAAVARGEDVTLAWEPIDGFVDVVVKTGTRSWPCVFPGKRGSAAIEGHLLRDEPAGPVVLRTAGLRTARTDVGGWHVSLTVASARLDRTVTLR